ncbi:hypothetical protein J6590_043367, partial [Homalodisca vitripennis]
MALSRFVKFSASSLYQCIVIKQCRQCTVRRSSVRVKAVCRCGYNTVRCNRGGDTVSGWWLGRTCRNVGFWRRLTWRGCVARVGPVSGYLCERRRVNTGSGIVILLWVVGGTSNVW